MIVEILHLMIYEILKIESTTIILIDKRKYKDLVIYLNRYVQSKSIKCLVWGIII